MAERPILFSGPMVRELLAGRKTQTRRPVKGLEKARCAADCSGPEPERAFVNRGLVGDACEYLSVPCRDGAAQRVFCPYGAPGDRLWVREAFMPLPEELAPSRPRPTRWSIVYAAGGEPQIATAPSGYNPMLYNHERWTPSIHMPRWASRLTLEVTSVRVERLHAITEEDAKAEGMEPSFAPGVGPARRRHTFATKWHEMYGCGDFGWNEDPWVWVVTFRRVGATGG